MKTTIYDYQNESILQTDLCVVGTGAAGLELAQHFDKSHQSVILLEGGFEKFDWNTQKLCRFNQIDRKIRSADHSKPFTFQEARKTEFRLRQYGGTLNMWAGKWKMLDPYDFVPKPGIKGTGWPITYDEVYRYYCEIAESYHLLDYLLMIENFAPHILGVKNEYFSSSLSYLEIPATNIKDKYDDKIRNSSNITLILRANVVNLWLTEDLKHIDHLVIKSLDGVEKRVKAKQYVLACGAIENARLLLCSNKQNNTGIGNAYGLVGRNLIDHPKGVATTIKTTEAKNKIYLSDIRMHNKVYPTEMGLNLELLKKLNLPNHCFTILPPISPESPQLHQIFFYLEQLPNFQSRIFLSDEVDELNLPIVSLDWKLSDEDKICFKKYIENMKKLLPISGIGELSYDDSLFEMNFLRDSNHQMGTTRMASRPEDGVVDVNCKVFGTDNLFISGSSVFPTSGNANPTFTILALSRRLSNYLMRT